VCSSRFEPIPRRVTSVSPRVIVRATIAAAH
jgi:hypothetical protein